MKRSLKEYIREREARSQGGMPESASFHSRGYRRYFEGYSEYVSTRPNGKQKIERIYTGVYHTLHASKERRRGLKICYALLYATSVVLFLWSVSRRVAGNLVWYAAAAQAAGTALLFVMLIALFGYITAPEHMTLYEYRSVRFLRKTSLTASVALFVLAAVRIIYSLLHIRERFSEEITCAAGCLVSAVCCLAVFLLERRNIYDTHLSEAEAPDNAHQIYL